MSKKKFWTGWLLSGIVILFMLFDSMTKIIKLAPVIEGSIEIGYAEHHVLTIGILGLLSTIFYAIPQTKYLGAILLTGYFGGAIASNLRIDAPLFTHVLFPVYFAILAWGGIWLRDEGLRKLLFPNK